MLSGDCTLEGFERLGSWRKGWKEEERGESRVGESQRRALVYWSIFRSKRWEEDPGGLTVSRPKVAIPKNLEVVEAWWDILLV